MPWSRWLAVLVVAAVIALGAGEARAQVFRPRTGKAPVVTRTAPAVAAPSARKAPAAAAAPKKATPAKKRKARPRDDADDVKIDDEEEDVKITDD